VTTSLSLIPLNLVDEHPLNPRLYFREPVIDGIAASLGDEFPRDHAVRVRAVGDRYQLVDGHHRVRAAKKAGLEAVWAWIVELDDEAALMELVRSNNQGELSPLEIGVHAFRAVPVEKGGRGNRGGLSEYARAIGRDKSQVSRLRQAGEVAETVESAQRFLEHATHLAEVHGAPRELWPDLADAVLARGWTVQLTKDAVARLGRFEIPEKWAAVFLDPIAVQREHVKTQRLAPDTVAQLAGFADSTEGLIRGLGGTGEHVASYHAWLRVNAGADAWDTRKLLERQKLLEHELSAAAEARSARWNHGDWREHVPALEDGSVALLLTDPPFGAEYRSNHRRQRHDAIANDTLDAARGELTDVLSALDPKLAADAHVLCFCRWREEPAFREVIEAAGLELRSSLIWDKAATGMGNLNGAFAPQHERILHAVKGSPVLYERKADVLRVPRVGSDRHPTEKPVALLADLICATTVQGDLVADPFGGVASTLVAATRAGRRAWGCELDAGYHAKGQERLEAADRGEGDPR
jgi:DNA modification methylase/ParB-like chromosome segregation protein Spo0J